MSAAPQSAAVATVTVATVREWLAGGGALAFVDVREEGQHTSTAMPAAPR